MVNGTSKKRKSKTIASMKSKKSNKRSKTKKSIKSSNGKNKVLITERSRKKEDPHRRWLKDMVYNFLRPDQNNVKYDVVEVSKLLDLAIEDVKTQPTLLEFNSPTYICGDIHGQITDLRRIFHICGYPNTKRFLFLGDYVDRGAHSIGVICVLLSLRLLFKDNVHLLRGNHELQHINKSYGFSDDINSRWGKDGPKTKELYRKFNETFAFLPLAAVINKKILCMHGGLSPDLEKLDNIRDLERPIQVPRKLAQDILWADPLAGITKFSHNTMRACSFNFGEKDVFIRLDQMELSKLIRAHQVVQFGWESFANGRVMTVFTASRYQDDLYNYGAIMDVQKNLKMEVIMIKPADFEEVKNAVQEELTKDTSKIDEEKSIKSERGKTQEDKSE